MPNPAAIEELFHAARLRPRAERAAYLRSACGHDPGTIALLESLLAADDAASGFLETPAAELIAVDRSAEEPVLHQSRSLQERSKDFISPGLAQEEPVPRQVDRSGWVGTTVGNYRILRVIAAGGMGIVYEAEQAAPKRTVALKLLRRALYSQAAVRRFQRESELLGRLRHPGIAQIYEAGVHREDGLPTPFFAMEYLAGAVALTDFARDRSLSVEQRIELLCKVCDAVDFCHEQGVVHRDLKPGNILVTSAGEPKVIDFGVAHAQTVESSTIAWRTTGHPLIGSLAYMSPEQAAADAQTIDAQTDVYALGVVAYEMLSGRLPLDLVDLPPLEAARRIRDEEPLPLGTVDRQFRGDLETIVSTAMAKEKLRRYPSAAALAADLRRHLADEPILARRTGALYRARKFVRRNRALSIGLSIAFAGLLVGGLAAAWQAGSAIRERNTARANEHRAERERLRAEENLRRARAVVDGMVTRLSHDLRDVPNMTEVQRALFEEALDFYEEVIQQGFDDPTIRKETGLAYLNVSRIHGTLRSFEQWGEAGQRATAIFRELHSAQPDDPEYLHLLAEGQSEVAGSLFFGFFGDRNEESLEPVLEVLEIRKRLAQRFPNDPAHRKRLAAMHAHLGNNLQRLPGRQAEAEMHFLESLALWEQFREDFPDLPVVDPDGEEAHTHHWLANVLIWYRHDYKEAEVHLRRAVEIRTKLVEERPEDFGRRAELGQARLWLGLALNGQGSIREAAAEFQSAIGFYQPLVELFPAVPRYRSRLRMAYNCLCWAMGWFDKQEAVRAATKAIALPASHDIDDPPGLAQAYYCLGCQAFGQGRLAEAAEAIRESVRLYDDIVTRQRPYRSLAEWGLRWILITSPLPEFRDPERALQLALQAREIDPLNPDHQKHAGFALYGLGRFEEAIEAIHSSMELGVDRDGDSCRLLAMAYWQLGDVTEARAWYDAAIEQQAPGFAIDHSVDLHAEFDRLDGDLPWVLHPQGDTAGAERRLREQLARSRERLGNGHPKTAELVYNLVALLHDAGDAAQAEFLLREELALSQAELGNGHPQTLEHLRNLSKVRFAARDFAEAEVLLCDGLATARAAPGDQRDIISRLLGMLGESLLKLQKYDEAEPVLRECLALREETLREGHPRVWSRHCAVQMLGGALAGQAAQLSKTDAQAAIVLFAEAEELLLAGYESMKDDPHVPDPSHNLGFDNIAESLRRIVQLYEAWHTVEPEMGYDTRAAEWRALLPE